MAALMPEVGSFPSHKWRRKTRELDNIAHVADEPLSQFEERDIYNPFDPRSVDYVFGFASPDSPRDCPRF